MDLEQAVVGYAGAGLLAVSANATGQIGAPGLDGAGLVQALVEDGLGQEVKNVLEAVARDLRHGMATDAGEALPFPEVVALLTEALAGWRHFAPQQRGLAPNGLVGAIVHGLPRELDPLRSHATMMRLMARIAAEPDMMAHAAEIFARQTDVEVEEEPVELVGAPLSPIDLVEVHHDPIQVPVSEGPIAATASNGAPAPDTGPIVLARIHARHRIAPALRGVILANAERSLVAIAQRLAAPVDDPVLGNLLTQAIAAISEGQFEDADTLMAGAAARHMAGIGHVATPEAALRRAAAELWELRASLQQAQLEHRRAAQYFESAAGVLDPGDIEGRWLYSIREGMVLNAMYEELGDVEALGQAIVVFARSLQIDSSDQGSELFALTHNSLGNCLLALADRERSQDKLELSIKSYRSALSAKPREPAPQEWALLQSNLGTACVKLGEMTDAREPFEEAVGALSGALGVFSGLAADDDRNLVQLNLGIALARLGGKSKDAGKLQQAAALLTEARSGFRADQSPEAWGRLQAALGDACVDLGELTSDPAWLGRGATAYRAIVEAGAGLSEVQRALAEANLGGALWSLASRTGEPGQGAEARQCMERAARVLTEAGQEALAAPIRANLAAMRGPAPSVGPAPSAMAASPLHPQAIGSPFDLRPGMENEPVLRGRAVGSAGFNR